MNDSKKSFMVIEIKLVPQSETEVRSNCASSNLACVV